MLQKVLLFLVKVCSIDGYGKQNIKKILIELYNWIVI